MIFEVLIDSRFLDVTTDDSLEPIDNKYVLSLANDFEDGQWRTARFINFIFDNIAETSLSHVERSALADKGYTQLVEAAKNLRILKTENATEGSELAEIFLYGIMKEHFGALPVVPKIFYKQNANDYAKGADSVHIVVDKNDFTLWMGEAKFFNNIEDARLGEIVTSVANSLSAEKIRKENRIISSVNELDRIDIDSHLRDEIKRLLSTDCSIDEIKPKLHIPILLLHECEITSKSTVMSEKYKQDIVDYHRERSTSYFRKQLNKLKDEHLYCEINFHIILVPVAVKQHVVECFLKRAKVLRDG